MGVEPLVRSLRHLPAALVLWIAAYALLVVLPMDQTGFNDLGQRISATGIPLLAALACLVRAVRVERERLAWALIAAAGLAWTMGSLYYGLLLWGAESIPFPSPADAGYLAFYPLAYAGFALLFRHRLRGSATTLWIDGLIGALGIAALGTAVVFQEVLNQTGGRVATVITNLAYPLGDVALLALVVGFFAATGWRLNRMWALLTGGLVLFAVADSIYLYQTALGTYSTGGMLDLGWPAAFAALTLAALTRPDAETAPAPAGAPATARPIAFAVASIALLVYDHFVRTNALAVALAAGCLAAALVRLHRFFGAYRQIVQASRLEAASDPLTGLGNRRHLMRELEARLPAHAEPRPFVLASFDLDGFKSYNDSFGHPAGDALLVRFGQNLAAAVAGHGIAFRTGGDEFVAILDVAGSGAPDVATVAAALHDSGEGFSIGCSYGSLSLPDEAGTPEHALRYVDQRMYGAKQRGRASARNQSADVLITALRERYPGLDPHLERVAKLSVEVARRLHLSDDLVEEIRLAAELHDVGKVAIPDTILAKPGPLSAPERAFLERHSEIGERIVAAAPALTSLARVVRSVHERIDGAGYPDGLAGRDIPLASRVVAVCDAFDAMVSARPYATASDPGGALEELRRCAGTQFDTRVVDEVWGVVLDEALATLMSTEDLTPLSRPASEPTPPHAPESAHRAFASGS